MKAAQTREIQMIVQAHDIANIILQIQTARRICEENGFTAEDFADARGERDGLHGMTFVETET
jgi:hypothetical protein